MEHKSSIKRRRKFNDLQHFNSRTSLFVRERSKGISNRKRRTKSLSILTCDGGSSFLRVLILGRNPFEEFHRHFPALPHEEFPLNVYTCALSKDILLQGKMFVSQNWICFYSNIFGYETKVKIEMNRIVEIKREKTAFVVPNAISVQTPNKRFFFCSFLSRETVFRLLSRTWTAAVSKRNSIDSQDSNDKDLSRTGCSDAAVTLLDLSADDLPHAVCSDIDQVKTSSPIPTKKQF